MGVGVSLSDRVARLVAAVGTEEAARMLGVAPGTVARVCAGLRVQRGTGVLVLQALDRLDSEGQDGLPRKKVAT